ncbi:MAG: Lrp/AsnC family transcriptional regulator [Candidatus Aenigmarchaeota archaeon]|nr:Lrp/AsnC family transcriptional regulator [Candidatus Aenigmarchaeota archaeon]
MELAEMDKKILKLLLEDARCTYHDISKKLKVTPATVMNRVKKLEKSGVIEAYQTRINLSKLGLNVISVVSIKAKPRMVDALAEKMKRMNEIRGAVIVSGEVDIFAFVRFKTTEELYAFVKKLLTLPEIESTRTYVAFDVIKPFKLTIPQDLE